MIEIIYIITTLVSLLIFKAIYRDKKLTSLILKSVIISSMVTILVCSIIAVRSTPSVKEEVKFKTANLEEPDFLIISGTFYKLDKTKEVQDTVFGILFLETKKKSQK